MKTQDLEIEFFLAFLVAMFKYALIPTSWVGRDNKAVRNVITPRRQQQELRIRVEEQERSKGKHYAIFDIHLLFRDPQITSICSYSTKKQQQQSSGNDKQFGNKVNLPARPPFSPLLVY